MVLTIFPPFYAKRSNCSHKSWSSIYLKYWQDQFTLADLWKGLPVIELIPSIFEKDRQDQFDFFNIESIFWSQKKTIDLIKKPLIKFQPCPKMSKQHFVFTIFKGFTWIKMCVFPYFIDHIWFGHFGDIKKCFKLILRSPWFFENVNFAVLMPKIANF